jgi:RNA polymerase sigma-70 factor (ECF subfamily)
MRDNDALENNPEVTRSALEAIHGQVFGWALSRCFYNQAEAEDLVQQAYLELLSGKAKFGRQSSLKTFVFSVVQNLARSEHRQRNSRLQLVRQHEAGRADPDDAHTYVPEPSENAAIWQQVQALPGRQRDIIELVFCREFTVEEASAVMGVTTGTGRVHYDRAKKALREKLGAMREMNA